MWWPETPREGVAEPRGTDEGGGDEQGWALSPTAATVSSLACGLQKAQNPESGLQIAAN